MRAPLDAAAVFKALRRPATSVDVHASGRLRTALHMKLRFPPLVNGQIQVQVQYKYSSQTGHSAALQKFVRAGSFIRLIQNILCLHG